MSLAIGLPYRIFVLNNGEVHGHACEYFFYEFPMISLFFCAFKTIIGSFSFKFHF
jgi:hypothetical protein